MPKGQQSLSDWLRQVEYAILDGAQSEEIATRGLALADDGCPLWAVSAEASEELQPLLRVAPYLLRFTPDSPFTEWLQQEGWGRHWGILFALRMPMPLETVKHHFLQFLQAQHGEDPAVHYYFRFYDPRVFRTFMKVCTPEQAQLLFAPVRHFVVEGESPDQLYLYRFNETVITTKVVLER